MTVSVLNTKGSEKGKIDLNDAVFNIEPNMHVIYESVKNELANMRQGTASSKTKQKLRLQALNPGGRREPVAPG
jgi:large subunit ribosomal protein L4